MTDPDRLAVMAEQRARDLLRAHRALDQAGIATMGKDNALTVPERVALLIGEVERLREVETDWDRVRIELMNAKRANANITQRLDLKLDELGRQDAEIERLRGLIAESCGCIST